MLLLNAEKVGVCLNTFLEDEKEKEEIFDIAVANPEFNTANVVPEELIIGKI